MWEGDGIGIIILWAGWDQDPKPHLDVGYGPDWDKAQLIQSKQVIYTHSHAYLSSGLHVAYMYYLPNNKVSDFFYHARYKISIYLVYYLCIISHLKLLFEEFGTKYQRTLLHADELFQLVCIYLTMNSKSNYIYFL